MRRAEVSRRTKETQIELMLNLDGEGKADVQTGIGFFDHMLTAFAVHSGFDLTVSMQGDLEVDGHHSVEDVGIALGQALAKSTVSKNGMARYGSFFIPMDEALVLAVVDFSNRGYLSFEGTFKPMLIGGYDPDLTEEFFRAMAMHGGITLHIKVLSGQNDHHKVEAIFKAVAHALKMAVAQTGDPLVLSSKGVI